MMTVYFNPIHQLRREMDRLFNGVLGPTIDGIWPGVGRGQPPVNLWDAGENLMAEMELPGVKHDEIDISVAGNQLTLHVQRSEEAEENVTYHRHERSVGSFNRVLELPCDVKADGVEAQLRDGILTLTLPKAETAKPRKVNINVS
jgi:HSP20 family protein